MTLPPFLVIKHGPRLPVHRGRPNSIRKEESVGAREESAGVNRCRITRLRAKTPLGPKAAGICRASLAQVRRLHGASGPEGSTAGFASIAGAAAGASSTGAVAARFNSNVKPMSPPLKSVTSKDRARRGGEIKAEVRKKSACR